jgi:hypothetical protein
LEGARGAFWIRRRLGGGPPSFAGSTWPCDSLRLARWLAALDGEPARGTDRHRAHIRAFKAAVFRADLPLLRWRVSVGVLRPGGVGWVLRKLAALGPAFGGTAALCTLVRGARHARRRARPCGTHRARRLKPPMSREATPMRRIAARAPAPRRAPRRAIEFPDPTTLARFRWVAWRSQRLPPLRAIPFPTHEVFAVVRLCQAVATGPLAWRDNAWLRSARAVAYAYARKKAGAFRHGVNYNSSPLWYVSSKRYGLDGCTSFELVRRCLVREDDFEVVREYARHVWTWGPRPKYERLFAARGVLPF